MTVAHQGPTGPSLPDDTPPRPSRDRIPDLAHRQAQRRTTLNRAEVAALLALLGAGLVAALLDRPAPLEPLAALIMEWTPVPVANWLLATLGPAGKPLALYGAAAVALAVAGPLGLLGVARWAGRASALLAIAVSVMLVLPLAGRGTLPGLAALLVCFWGAFFGQELYGNSSGAPAGRVSAPALTGRRALLKVGLNATGLLAVSLLPVAASRVRLRLIGRVARAPLFAYDPPPARKPGFDLPGLTPEITPLPNFYRMSKNVADPVLDATSWSLKVGGQVRRSLSFTLDQLAALPRTDQYVTMQCVSNPVGGPLWSATMFSGVPLADLLARAEPLADAAWVSFEAPDGHREQLPLARAGDPLVLLAYGMAGDWLTQEHGFPVRLLVPGVYGFRSVKWLTRIDVLATPRPGHWEERGWSATDIHTTARVDLVQRSDGEGVAAGVAFAGVRGV
ncbi:MAG: molybdopterin-dependent oxidoreductase, partial [Chloroflexota bacterium]